MPEVKDEPAAEVSDRDVDNRNAPSDKFLITKLRRLANRHPDPDWKIASALDIHPTLFSQYVNGRRDIHMRHAVQLAFFFNCEPSDIVGWDEEISSIEALQDVLPNRRIRSA